MIDGPTIDAKRLIDQHYYAIASKATLLKPSELPVPEDKFQEFFGVSFQDAIAQGTAVNALDACKKLDCTPDELRAEWRAVCKSGDMIKFGGGFYCGKIKGLQIFNPFFMACAVYTFTANIYFDVSSIRATPWAAFRARSWGPRTRSVPSGSLRRSRPTVGGLGLPSRRHDRERRPRVASPFVPRGAHEPARGEPKSDSFGAALSRPTSRRHDPGRCKDPRVALGGGAEGSVFDAFEDLDAQECLKKAVEIERVDAFGE